MRVAILTLFPEMFGAQNTLGVVGRAINDGRMDVSLFNPRDYAQDKHNTVDDRPFGGGAGMVMQIEPLLAALNIARAKVGSGSNKTVLLSPSGTVFKQQTALTNLSLDGLILICGRYEGIDQRFVDKYIDEQWSIGDYVISGGELAAMVVVDALARHIPGVLGNNQSIIDESHLDGRLDYPQYTRPENAPEGSVPGELLSGDHNKVRLYRRREALRTTFERRPDLLTQQLFAAEERRLLKEVIDTN
ncbi:MAG: tRNA (guanosine(37)-N1)-methyltransferase TrmD [Pseudomonadales bacterium]|nr:tRNA (guanosine(37)-N1)-methyltransferase TrmD [Pseudomonadales bacterium]